MCFSANLGVFYNFGADLSLFDVKFRFVGFIMFSELVCSSLILKMKLTNSNNYIDKCQYFYFFTEIKFKNKVSVLSCGHVKMLAKQ